MRYSAIRKGVLSLLGHSFDKFEFSNKIAEHLEKMDEILARFPYQISLGLTFRTLTRSKQRIFYLVFQNNFLTNTTSDGNPFFTIAGRSVSRYT